MTVKGKVVAGAMDAPTDEDKARMERGASERYERFEWEEGLPDSNGGDTHCKLWGVKKPGVKDGIGE